MEVISRSAITVTPRKPFIDWNNALFPDMPLQENAVDASKTYLTDELLNNAGNVVKKHFKEIFEAELEGMCMDENEWPAKRTFAVFNEWFHCQVSDWVIDLGKKDMFGE